MTNLLLNLLIQGPQEPGTPAGVQLPNAASTFAAGHDGLFYFVYWVSVFFFVLITGILLYSVVKYRRRTPDQAPASEVTHNTALEVTWTVIPLIIVMVIFAWGWKDMKNMTLAPADAHQFEVSAKRWEWTFKHPGANGFVSRKVYVPLGEPCQFTMSSEDVLHSFYIPAFRQKRDVLPGRYQTIWFTATHLGTFDVYCTEFCGDSHSLMLAQVEVIPKADWEARYKEKRWANWTGDPIADGKTVFQNKCSSCHNNDATKKVGPGLGGLWGTTETMADGSTAKVDEEYFIESVREPNKKIVKGYPGGMQAFPESEIPADQLGWLIEYVKSIGPNK